MVNESNPRRHVIIALALTTMLFVIAGNRWNERIARFGPVRAVQKGEK